MGFRTAKNRDDLSGGAPISPPLFLPPPGAGVGWGERDNANTHAET
jgi:hypothetical protein